MVRHKYALLFSKILITGILVFSACNVNDLLLKSGLHYQTYFDIESLQKVVRRLPANADTAYVRKILGEPIDMGFDYRYLVDSTGPNGCVVGAVFHIAENGKIDQKWIGEICE